MKTYILTLCIISGMVLMLGLQHLQAADQLNAPAHSLQIVSKNVDVNKASAFAKAFGGGR